MGRRGRFEWEGDQQREGGGEVLFEGKEREETRKVRGGEVLWG